MGGKVGKISEIDALKAVDTALSGVDDPTARERVLSWAWKKFVSTHTPATADETGASEHLAKKTKKKVISSSKAKGKAKNKVKAPLTMERDLNLKPKGKKSLDDFVNEKKPNSIYEKCTVVAYYLKHVLAIPAVSANHIYTCFKHMKWRTPANLLNSLAYTASHYGWLDTHDRNQINVSTMGENLIEHDLPRIKSSKKK
jgi:hypothetical protein